MQIDSIKLFHVALPLRQPLETAAGALSTLETVLVRMQSGEADGWGEASPGNAPTAGAEWAAGVFALLRDWLAPAVRGTAVDSGQQLQQRLEPFRGNRFAKAALDTAWWDLHARLQDKPLHELLGGKRHAIQLGPTFDKLDSIDELLSAIGRSLQAGFARVRLMFRPGWDVQMVDLVRKEFPTDTFHVDVEGALGLEHTEMLQRLDDFDLAMIEQPLPPEDLVGHAMVQESLRTPICLDESITTIAQAELALELQSCKYVNINPGRVGGLTPAVAVHDASHQSRVPCFVGAMPQSAIGARIGLALAAKENFTYPADFFPSEQFLRTTDCTTDFKSVLQQDLAEPPLPERDEADGKLRVTLWSQSGIGVEPDGECLNRFSIAQAEVV